ncbi:helix-turn-helix transcriptional regulator [Streptomyces sp. MJP52]|uniref:helix-turn-helix domain-containing protein n=1 Tax=Streptomyces sp. MJP52 TaxID=2940555 RepID=UPI002476837A|nr:helix-turn-helix transcriptional regulator [Streptomyces sp. MJP52]
MTEDGAGGAGVAAAEVDREPQPSDSLRTFGAVVQALRENAGISREEFGWLVRYSKHTVAAVEYGRRMPDPSFVERAEEVLGNTGALRRSARFLTRGEAGLAAWFRQWARLEREAVSLCTYECRLVPGLLQTEGYARALFEDRLPVLTDEQLEAQVAARLGRQRLLRERVTVPFSFIVEEAVFRRRLGGSGVLREQLVSVLAFARARNITLQVVPLDVEHHSCVDGPVQLVETREGRRLAYCEGQENGRLITEVKEVGILQQRYDTLRSQALNPTESQGLLERILGEL